MHFTAPNTITRAYLKTPDAARFIGVSRRGFLDLAAASGLDSFKPSPRLRLWRTTDLQALVESARDEAHTTTTATKGKP